MEVIETTLGVSYVNTHGTGGSSQWCAVTTSGQTDASVDVITVLHPVSGKRVTRLALAHLPDNAAEHDEQL